MGSTPKKIKLKRCPFCGGKAEIKLKFESRIDEAFKIHGVGCAHCDTFIKSARIDTAAKLWNTRKADETEDKFVEVDGVWIQKVKEEKNDNIPC